MTTNHSEKLDPALIRPGRRDRKIFIDNATVEQGRRMFKTKKPGIDIYAKRSSGKKFASCVSHSMCPCFTVEWDQGLFQLNEALNAATIASCSPP
jgi:ATP-dependent 26S proteasome regulatory subunit